MTPLFLDTSYLIALTDANDQFHQAAVAFSAKNLRPLVTTGAIVLELGAHYSKAGRRNIFLRLLELLAKDAVEIVTVDGPLQERGIELFRRRSDKNWSLADCISFETMGDRGLTEAATSDEHFEQAGFAALLRISSAAD